MPDAHQVLGPHGLVEVEQRVEVVHGEGVGGVHERVRLAVQGAARAQQLERQVVRRQPARVRRDLLCRGPQVLRRAPAGRVEALRVGQPARARRDVQHVPIREQVAVDLGPDRVRQAEQRGRGHGGGGRERVGGGVEAPRVGQLWRAGGVAGAEHFFLVGGFRPQAPVHGFGAQEGDPDRGQGQGDGDEDPVG